MDLQAIKSLLEDFDLEKFVPELETLLGKLEFVMRIAVMAAPLCLLGLGLLYFLGAPKEANHYLGYRCHRGMASVESWQFTQKFAGLFWTVLGLVLTIVMAVVCNGFRGMELMDMVWLSVRCLVWQIALALISILIINTAVFVVFDRKGISRKEKRELKKAQQAAEEAEAAESAE